MDNLDLNTLQNKTEQATNNLTNLQTSVPGLLRDLRSSLASIYAKDNPLIQARDEALSRFLATPANTRAEILTPNLPVVAGTPLTLSPTQQNAITTSRESAALAPLLGLNQAVLAGYGNIQDIVQGAATQYASQVEAARTNLAHAADIYKQALAQDQFNREFAEKKRQFDIQETRLNRQAQTGQILDPATQALLTAILTGQNQPAATPSAGPVLNNPWQIVSSTQQPITIPGQQGQIYPYTPPSTNVSIPLLSGIANWWNNLSKQPAPATGTGLNLLGMGGSVGPFR